MTIVIDYGKCEGCEECVKVCPVSLFEINDDGKAQIKEDKVDEKEEEGNKVIFTSSECIECRACEAACPKDAINIQ